jgi:hypothetical protein
MTHLNIRKMSNNNSRPRRKTTQVEPERDVRTVEHPPTEKPVLKVETPKPNKYEPKPKIGAATLGRSPNYVTKVGLGNLKVTTAHGSTDV